MWDIETIKAAIVSAIVAFVGSALFYEIVKIAIRKLVEKITGAVTALKDEQVITQAGYDKIINYINERDADFKTREERLVERVGDILDRIPDSDALARVDVYLGDLQQKIDAFLSEVDDE